MTNIILASKSPLKLAALQNVLDNLDLDYEIKTIPAPSLVPDQPIGRTETEQGARNRIIHCLQDSVKVDLYLAIENGVIFSKDKIMDVPVIALFSNKWESIRISYGAEFPVPPYFFYKSLENRTCIGTEALRHYGTKFDDYMSYITEGKVTRQEILEQAIKTALIMNVEKPDTLLTIPNYF